MTALITYDQVRFLRGNQLILDNVSWTVQKNEHWAILGLNGSGKSTMLNMMGGYEFPTSGRIQVFGHQYGRYNWEHIKKQIGFVGNTLNRFLETLNTETAREIVVSGRFNSIGIYEQTKASDWEKANELLAAFRLSYLAEKPYRLLSQGEQRRVLLARAFMAEPKIMILDEPCSGLDVRAREELLASLEKQADQSKASLLYVTHHIEEIFPAITHVAVVKNGQMLASGLKKQVLNAHILSEAFDIPVEIDERGGRFWLKIAQ